ncbi:MAG: hypothetical protein JSW71_03950 [Gemmatimonadota bacterium]|nr:MAG: hypothetical protein JSW71_03950 [Gemmatimonadota bacterium]
MEWMLPVLALALLWWWLRKKRPPAPEPKPLPDARLLLADELEQRAAAAWQEGRVKEARVIALRSAWMRTHPRLGDDEPPTVFDANEGRHLRLASEIWGKYQEARAEVADGSDADSWLPYPKESVVAALRLLLNLGEGTVESPHVDPRDATPQVLAELRTALGELG